MHSLFVQGALEMTGWGGPSGSGPSKDEGSPSAPRLDDLEDQRMFGSIRGRLFGREGSVSIGRYRLEGRLGAGAMGEVFLARDPDLDRLVAIKLVHAHLTDERYAARLRREAKALARLAHPNVVRVYEVGEHEGRVFLAMEYVRGGSLRTWIAERRPSWAAVLEAYVQAGRGLAAAHQAGLTHRDFKPDNVLRGDDGRILVADFGLASLEGKAGEARDASWSAGTSTDPEMPLTRLVLSQTGEIKGTPAYMPPEQFQGLPLDGRADQFAYSVAVYEGLWGVRPFAEGSLRIRMMASVRGPQAPSDRRKGVPDWVWPVLERGLAHGVDERWASMDALLDALETIPRRRGRRRRSAGLGLALGVTAAAAGLVGATWWSESQPAGITCDGVTEELEGVWDEARRDEVQRALEALESPLAAETAARVEREFDAWTSRWIIEQTASCKATRIQGTQSESMLDRRTVCMQRQRREAGALVDVLVAGDLDTVARMGPVLAALPDLGACGVEALGAGAVPNVDPAQADEVEAGYDALARARAQLAVGHPDRATALADQALAQGEATGHAPLTLEARAMQAEVTMRSGKLEAGLEALREVVLVAERAELLELVADLRVQLARAAAGDFAEPRLERWIIDEAQAAIDRVARPDDPREVVLQSARARIAEQAGDYDAAIAAHERAYALAEGRLADGPRALLRMGVGTAMYGNGDYEGARAELLRTLEAVRATWGEGAPEAARIEYDLGLIAIDRGQLEEAKQHLRSTIEIDQTVWGADSLEVARDRLALASLAFETEDLDEACTAITRVLTVYEAELGVDHDETASAINADAICRYYAGDFASAIEGYRRALTIQRQTLGEEHPEIGVLHTNIGLAQLGLGRLEESLASQECALAILTAKLPADHPYIAGAIAGRALVWIETGREAETIDDLERALVLNPQGLPSAEMRFGLARALVAMHGRRDRERASTLAREALEGFERAGVEHRARAVRAWLAEHAD